MKKFLFSFILIFLLASTAFGVDSVFLKMFGGSNYEEAWSLIRTADGGYVSAGYTMSYGTMSLHDIQLTKFDSTGSLVWMKTLGGTGNYDIANCVIQASDGGFVLVGATSSFSVAGVDALISKFDSSGNHLWTRTFGGSGNEEASSVVQTDDSGYLITGFTKSYSVGGDADVFLVKYDSSGTFSWMKTFGGVEDDYGVKIIRVSDGNYIIVGITESYSVGGDNDVFLMKVDSSGTIIWTKTYGGTGEDRAATVIESSDGGFVLGGWTKSYGLAYREISIAKVDSSGSHLWMKSLSLGNNDDWGGYVVEASDGGYAIAGQTYPVAYPYAYFLLSKFNSSGTHLWSSRVGNATWACWVKSFTYGQNGGFLMSGEIQGIGAGTSDIPLVKFNESGISCGSAFVSPTATSRTPTITSQSITFSDQSPTTANQSPTVTSPTPTTTLQCETLFCQMTLGTGSQFTTTGGGSMSLSR